MLIWSFLMRAILYEKVDSSKKKSRIVTCVIFALFFVFVTTVSVSVIFLALPPVDSPPRPMNPPPLTPPPSPLAPPPNPNAPPPSPLQPPKMPPPPPAQPPFSPIPDPLFQAQNINSCTRATNDGTVFPRKNEPFTIFVKLRTNKELAEDGGVVYTIAFWGSWDKPEDYRSFSTFDFLYIKGAFSAVVFVMQKRTLDYANRGVIDSYGRFNDGAAYGGSSNLTIIMTFDGETHSLQSSDTQVNKTLPGGSTNMTLDEATDSLFIGCKPNNVSNLFPFGHIEDFRIWNEVIDLTNLDSLE